jgi:hypothetical protein
MTSFTLTLDERDVELVLNGLAQLPLGLAAPTFNKIQAQSQQQRERGSDGTSAIRDEKQ